MTQYSMNYHHSKSVVIIFIIIFLLLISIILNNPILINQINAANAATSQNTTVYLPLAQNGYPKVSLFGIQLEFAKTDNGLDEMRAAGSNWIRYNGVIWSDIEPTKGTRNWTAMGELETELIRASQEGAEVLLIIRSTPTWAQKIPGAYCGPIKQSELASFGHFVYDVVSRYSKPPYNVKYWEVWNEPDVQSMPIFYDDPWGCWGDTTDDYYGGGYFAEMLKTVYPRMKAADPMAQVVIGGLLLDCDPRPNSNWCEYWNHDTRPPKFFEGILKNNGGGFFDGVAFHGYDYFDYTDPQLGEYLNPVWGNSWNGVLWDGSSTNRIGPVSTFKAGYLTELLSRYNVKGKFLINTEAALVCGSANDPQGSPGCETEYNSLYEQTKAIYIAHAYSAATKDKLVANIWYHVFGWRNSALLNRDLSARQAYYAYDTANTYIGGVSFSRNITSYSGVQIYEFERNNKTIWVIWSLDGTPRTITLPSAPDSVKDYTGIEKNPSSTFIATLDPHYLIWYP